MDFSRFPMGIFFAATMLMIGLTLSTANAQYFDQPAEDGKIVKGVLTRSNAPAFTLKIPTEMKLGKSYTPSTIWAGNQQVSPFSLTVDVYEDVTDLDDIGEKIINGFKWYTDSIKSEKFKVVRSESMKSYKEHQAKVIQFNWMWTDGVTELTTIHHFIIKGENTIGLSATVIGEITPATDVYATINLDPKWHYQPVPT